MIPLTEITAIEGQIWSSLTISKGLCTVFDVPGIQLDSWKDAHLDLRHSQRLSVSKRHLEGFGGFEVFGIKKPLKCWCLVFIIDFKET